MDRVEYFATVSYLPAWGAWVGEIRLGSPSGPIHLSSGFHSTPEEALSMAKKMAVDFGATFVITHQTS